MGEGTMKMLPPNPTSLLNIPSAKMITTRIITVCADIAE